MRISPIPGPSSSVVTPQHTLTAILGWGFFIPRNNPGGVSFEARMVKPQSHIHVTYFTDECTPLRVRVSGSFPSAGRNHGVLPCVWGWARLGGPDPANATTPSTINVAYVQCGTAYSLLLSSFLSTIQVLPRLGGGSSAHPLLTYY